MKEINFKYEYAKVKDVQKFLDDYQKEITKIAGDYKWKMEGVPGNYKIKAYYNNGAGHCFTDSVGKTPGECLKNFYAGYTVLKNNGILPVKKMARLKNKKMIIENYGSAVASVFGPNWETGYIDFADPVSNKIYRWYSDNVYNYSVEIGDTVTIDGTPRRHGDKMRLTHVKILF